MLAVAYLPTVLNAMHSEVNSSLRCEWLRACYMHFLLRNNRRASIENNF